MKRIGGHDLKNRSVFHGLIPFPSRGTETGKRVNFQSLKGKIFLTGISLVLLSTMISSGLFYVYVSRQTEETAYKTSSDLSVQISNYFDEKFRTIISRIYTMLRSDDFSSTSSYSYWGRFLLSSESYYYASAISQISPDLTEIRSSDRFIDSVYIYTSKGDFIDNTMVRKHGLDFLKTKLYQQLKNRESQGVYWGKSGADEIYEGGKSVIPVVIPYTAEGFSGDIYIVVSLKSSAVKSYLSSIQSQQGGNIIIADPRRREIVFQENDSTNELVADSENFFGLFKGEKGTDSISGKKDRYILSYDTSVVSSWSFVLLEPQQHLFEGLNKARNYTFLVILASAFLCILVSLFISNGITKPLKGLENTIKKVTARDFNVQFRYDKDDEIGSIGRSFNFMLVEIRDLIERLNSTIQELSEEKDRVKEEQLLKRKAELTALQAQINPHFLYNTLNSIVWMADELNAVEISRMSAALGTFFKVSLSNGNEIIPLKYEFEHVGSYLYIQKIRFAEKLSYTVDIDEEILKFMTIKLILQPLVENAICHGINERDGQGEVHITGGFSPDGQRIEMHVFDNGVGIPKPKLDLINRRLLEGFSTKQEGYGIYNVNERIRLCFGGEYGLLFSSEEGKGTDVKVTIPAMHMDEPEKFAE